MTEWEKLRQGLVYDDFSDELFEQRVRAKRLFKQYNATTDGQTELRQQLLGDLLGGICSNVWIEPDFRCEFGKNIFLGDDVYINFGAVILDCAEVTVGAQTLIGPNVGIYAVNHSLDPAERVRGVCRGAPVHVGKRVWLGGDVKIVAGVTIGDDSVIGTGSVVTKDIPAGVVAVGNPCRVLRPITAADKIAPER